MSNGIEYTLYYYDQGFFGYGAEGDFKALSLAHFLPIIIAILAIILIYKYRVKIANFKHEETLRFIYAAIMLFFEMGFFWWLLYVGPNYYDVNSMLNKLPLQICEWTLLICVFMMMKKSPTLFSMVFYLTLSCGLVPLILPAVITHTGPTYFRYYQYWAEHLLPIIGMFYMMFVHKMEPKNIGIVLNIIMILIMMVISIKLNSIIEGANYLYLTDISALKMLSFIPDSLIIRIIILWSTILLLMFIDHTIYKYLSKHHKCKTSE